MWQQLIVTLYRELWYQLRQRLIVALHRSGVTVSVVAAGDSNTASGVTVSAVTLAVGTYSPIITEIIQLSDIENTIFIKLTDSAHYKVNVCFYIINIHIILSPLILGRGIFVRQVFNC